MKTRHRHQKECLVVVWVLIFGAAVGLSRLATSDAKQQLVLKACAKKKSPVVFPHRLHAKKAKIPCKGCHHKGKPKTRCTDAKCHAGPATAKRPGCTEMGLKKNAFHLSCLACHKKQAKGPTTCVKCHQAKP